MKAYESVEKFLPTMRMYTNFAVRGIRKICMETGAREAGSEAEHQAQQAMAAQIGDAADDVREEAFSLAPRAFLGWTKIAGCCLILAALCGVVNVFVLPQTVYAAYVGLAAVALTLLLLLSFLTRGRLADVFFKKAESHNVYCVRSAAGTPTRRVVLVGHADSSPEWRFLRVGSKSLLHIVVAYNAVGLAYTAALAVLMLLKGSAADTQLFVWIGCAFLPGYVGLMCFVNYKSFADGAVDGLTGCMVSAAVLKFMGDNKLRFDHTEVTALFTGGNEAGRRGAAAAVKAHPEWKADGVETLFLCVDPIGKYEHLALGEKDMAGAIKSGAGVRSLMKNAAAAAEAELPGAKLPTVLSDAGAFAAARLPAVSLAAVDPALPPWFHTCDDKADVMEPKAIEKALQIALEAVYLFDEKGAQGAGAP